MDFERENVTLGTLHCLRDTCKEAISVGKRLMYVKELAQLLMLCAMLGKYISCPPQGGVLPKPKNDQIWVVLINKPGLPLQASIGPRVPRRVIPCLDAIVDNDCIESNVNQRRGMP